MSRPRSQAEYLARLVPPSVAGINRRSLLAGAAGTGALLGTGLLAGCGDDSGSGRVQQGRVSSAPTSPTRSRRTSSPRSSTASRPRPACRSRSTRSTTTPSRRTSTTTCRASRTTSSPGSPATGCGSSPRKGLAGDISDVWGKLCRATPTPSRRRRPATTASSTSCRRLLPVGGVLPQDRLAAERLPGADDARRAQRRSATQMKKDGLIPIAFADKDGWPAMGTFDILNMRINGYQFHIDLMAGKEAVDRPTRSRRSSTPGPGCCPCTRPDALGRTWQEAAQSLQQKKAGMYLLGLFVGQQFSDDGAERPRLLHLPRDRPGHRRRRDRRADRRLHDGQASPRTRPAPRSCWSTSVGKDAADIYRQDRPDHPGRQHERGHQRLHRAAEEGGRARRLGQEHRPVPGPRHPARLRVDRDDPGAPGSSSRTPRTSTACTSIENQKKSIFTD